MTQNDTTQFDEILKGFIEESNIPIDIDILNLEPDQSDIILDLDLEVIKAANDFEINQQVNHGASTSSQMPSQPQQTENDKSHAASEDVPVSVGYKTVSDLPPAKTKSSSAKATTSSSSSTQQKTKERKRKSADDPILESNSNRKKAKLSLNDCLAKVELPLLFSCCSRMIAQRLEYIMEHILQNKCLVYQDVSDYFHAVFKRELVASETQNLRWKENHNTLMSQYKQLQSDYETYSLNMGTACDDLKKKNKKLSEDFKEKIKVSEDKKDEEIKELKTKINEIQKKFHEKRRNMEKNHQDVFDNMIAQNKKDREEYTDYLKLKDDKEIILQETIDNLTKENNQLKKVNTNSDQYNYQNMIDHVQRQIDQLQHNQRVGHHKKQN